MFNARKYARKILSPHVLPRVISINVPTKQKILETASDVLYLNLTKVCLIKVLDSSLDKLHLSKCFSTNEPEN